MIANTPSDVKTAEQLFALPDDGKRYELIGGVLRMMSPAGSEHGDVAMVIGASLYRHVKQLGIGKTYAAETGFLIARNPDTVLAADAAFVSFQVLEKTPRTRGYLNVAPDLVVEVVSPNDVFSEVEEKVSQWLAAGSKLVLVANPNDRTLRVYCSSEKIQILRGGEVFDSGDACSNWQLGVDEVFE